jgi:hypothetical protein
MISVLHNTSGITLFSKVFNNFCETIDPKSNSELIGCFINALSKFSRELGQSEIKQIEMTSLKFLISVNNDVMILFVLDREDNREDYTKSLQMCLKIFLKMFSEDIEANRVHNLTNFRQFNPILYEILKINPSHIEESCLTCPMWQKKNCLFEQVREILRESDQKHSSDI